MKMMYHVLIIFIATFFMFAIGLVIIDNIESTLDLEIIINELQTNQTYVDNLTCDKIMQMINLLDSPFTSIDHADELVVELEIVQGQKHCEDMIER